MSGRMSEFGGGVAFTRPRCGLVGKRLGFSERAMRSRPFGVACRNPTTGNGSRKQTVRPVVSVCIVNWNCQAPLLRSCLRSLQLEIAARVRLEVIVVDNASTDGAADMVQRRLPARRAGAQRRKQSASPCAKNPGARPLGRLLLPNNDTVVPPSNCAASVEYAREHPEIGLLGPRGARCPRRAGMQSCCWPTARRSAASHVSAGAGTCPGPFRAAYRRVSRAGTTPGRRRPAVEVLMEPALLARATCCGGRRLGRGVRLRRRGHRPVRPASAAAGRWFIIPGIEIIHHGRAEQPSDPHRPRLRPDGDRTGGRRACARPGNPRRRLWSGKEA